MYKEHWIHSLLYFKFVELTLAYNVGHSRLLGYGKRPKSNLIKKIESGDWDIYEEYISYRCYKGKPIPSIERRRKREFQLLYIP